MTNRVNKYIKQLKTDLIIQFGGECSMCGSKKNLEFAHITPTKLSGVGRGRKERYYDIKNNPECYALMCKNCHVMYDHDKT